MSLSLEGYAPHEGILFLRCVSIDAEGNAFFRLVPYKQQAGEGWEFYTKVDAEKYHGNGVHKPDVQIVSLPGHLRVMKYNEVYAVTVNIKPHTPRSMYRSKPRAEGGFLMKSSKPWVVAGTLVATLVPGGRFVRVAVTPGCPEAFDAQLRLMDNTPGRRAWVGNAHAPVKSVFVGSTEKMPTDKVLEDLLIQLHMPACLKNYVLLSMKSTLLSASGPKRNPKTYRDEEFQRGSAARVGTDPRMAPLIGAPSLDLLELDNIPPNRKVVVRAPRLHSFLSRALASADGLNRDDPLAVRHLLATTAPAMDASVTEVQMELPGRNEVVRILVRPDALVRAATDLVPLRSAPNGVALHGEALLLVASGTSTRGTQEGSSVPDRHLVWAPFKLPVDGDTMVRPLCMSQTHATAPLSFVQHFTNRLGGVYARAEDPWTDGELARLRTVAHILFCLHNDTTDPASVAFKERVDRLC